MKQKPSDVILSLMLSVLLTTNVVLAAATVAHCENSDVSPTAVPLVLMAIAVMTCPTLGDVGRVNSALPLASVVVDSVPR